MQMFPKVNNYLKNIQNNLKMFSCFVKEFDLHIMW